MSFSMMSPAMLAVPLAIAVAAGSAAVESPLAAPEAMSSAVRSTVGPPWISIEYPANPLDRTTRGAYLLVHAFHHGTAVALPVRGTAEGLVDGKRRTISLDFSATSRPGVYALARQWPDDGRWMLVITVTQGGEDDGATALVRLAPTGEIASVEVPSRQQGGWTIPTAVSRRDVETALARHVAATTRNGRALAERP